MRVLRATRKQEDVSHRSFYMGEICESVALHSIADKFQKNIYSKSPIRKRSTTPVVWSGQQDHMKIKKKKKNFNPESQEKKKKTVKINELLGEFPEESIQLDHYNENQSAPQVEVRAQEELQCTKCKEKQPQSEHNFSLKVRPKANNVLISSIALTLDEPKIFSIPKEKEYQHFSRILKSRLCQTTEIERVDSMRHPPKLQKYINNFSYTFKKYKKSKQSVSKSDFKKVQTLGCELKTVSESCNNYFSPKLSSKHRPSSGSPLKKPQSQFFVKRPISSAVYQSPYSGIQFRKISALTEDIHAMAQAQPKFERMMSPSNTEQTKRRSIKVSKYCTYERQDSQILPWPNDEKVAFHAQKKSLDTPFEICL